MKKTGFKTTCRFFGIKPKALRERSKGENIKVKNTTKKQMLETIFVYAPTLMFSRNIGYGEVEYLEKDIPQKLAKAMAEERGDTQ
jgi:hypothetical protein